MTKRVAATLLALVMVFTSIPSISFASGLQDTYDISYVSFDEMYAKLNRIQLCASNVNWWKINIHNFG